MNKFALLSLVERIARKCSRQFLFSKAKVSTTKTVHKGAFCSILVQCQYFDLPYSLPHNLILSIQTEKYVI